MSTWSWTDDQSSKSWGTPPIRVTSPVSPSTWGTLSTTTTSNSSLQAAIDHKVPWGSPNNIIVGSPQGWASNASPPIYPSPSSTLGVGTYGGYSSPPPTSWTQLNPLLDSHSPQCIKFDIGCALSYMPHMNEPAVHPPATFMQLFIVVQPFKWPVNIQVHGPVSVYQVLQQLHEYLQGYDNTQDPQRCKLIPSGYNLSQSNRFRDQSHPSEFHTGQKRIDLLARHRIFRGLSPEPGSTCAWVVRLTDR